MRTLAVARWFCLEYFHFLLTLSFPTSLSSRAAAFLYAPVRDCACGHVLVDVCACVRVLRRRGIAEREREVPCGGGRRFCWGLERRWAPRFCAVGTLPLHVILLAPSPCDASILPSLLKSSPHPHCSTNPSQRARDTSEV